MNALLDYGSSSESGEDSNESSSSKEGPKVCVKPKLPKPSIGENPVHTSVFSNPFVAEERAKAALLEKHVKMVPGKEDTQMINGKKICWNYRKGRCRFGHKCRFAHDSDIQKTAEELDDEKKKLNTVVCEGAGTMTSAVPPQTEIQASSPTDDVFWEGGGDKKKLKRPGLSQALVPGKKVAKMYKEQKLRDSKNK